MLVGTPEVTVTGLEEGVVRGSVKRCVKGFQAAASLFFVTATPSTNSTPS
jgi:hypothetical protein